MVKKDLVINLSVEALKTAIVLLTLLIISRFIESLPFSGLPVFNSLITAADVLTAFISAAAITVFIKAGLNAKSVVDELLHWLPGAGTLLNYLTGIIALLFAYSAFQTVVFPFIRELEWAYQALFLAGTLFLLAKVGIHIYGASESVSRFLISIFHQYEVKAGPGIENK